MAEATRRKVEDGQGGQGQPDQGLWTARRRVESAGSRGVPSVSIDAGQHLLHYRFIEKIREAGMGVVWQAGDPRLQRRVALKVLPELPAGDPHRQTRFEREARTVAALNRPNIAMLHSVEGAETPCSAVHFITMELVEGRTVTQLLPREGFPGTRSEAVSQPTAPRNRSVARGVTQADGCSGVVQSRR